MGRPKSANFDCGETKTGHYMLRGVATAGEKGPWSETARASIGA